jgi:DNA polymerase III epsilon subunit-like protein
MEPLFLDTETTDNDERARLVQLAYKEAGDKPIVNELFKPPVPIAIDAMAVHHITNERVADMPTFEASGYREKLNILLNKHILVAHNAPFDMRILANEGVKTGAFINTLRVARHMVDSPKYSLQYLRYLLKLNTEGVAHDALGDVMVLEALFGELTRMTRERFHLTLFPQVTDKMLELTQTPVLLKTLQFGMHKGETFEAVSQKDKGHLKWLLESETRRPAHEQGEDLIYTIQHYLKAVS